MAELWRPLAHKKERATNRSKIMTLKEITNQFEQATEALKRLSAGGSSPASCSRTREAGRKHDATTDHATAPPFPDQGGGGVLRVAEKWRAESAVSRLYAESYRKVGNHGLNDVYKSMADLSDRHASELEAALWTEPLTQSGEGGNEVCECRCDHPVGDRGNGIEVCLFCDLPKSTLSERERSGSGNSDIKAIPDDFKKVKGN